MKTKLIWVSFALGAAFFSSVASAKNIPFSVHQTAAVAAACSIIMDKECTNSVSAEERSLLPSSEEECNQLLGASSGENKSLEVSEKWSETCIDHIASTPVSKCQEIGEKVETGPCDPKSGN